MINLKVKVNIDDALRYLGYSRGTGNDVDSLVLQQLQECSQALEALQDFGFTYKVYELDSIPDLIDRHTDRGPQADAGIQLKGTNLRLTGLDAARLLKECTSCIIMAVTLGRSSDMLIRRTQVTNMGKALVMDCCASSAAEGLAEQVDAWLRMEFGQRGLFLTDRYSPGYGDMPLELQRDICRLLETEKRMGMSCGDSLMLTPTKSITAIIGISDKPQPQRIRGCGSCQLKPACSFLKNGSRCWGQ